jgi:hypothetical protein
LIDCHISNRFRLGVWRLGEVRYAAESKQLLHIGSLPAGFRPRRVGEPRSGASGVRAGAKLLVVRFEVLGIKWEGRPTVHFDSVLCGFTVAQLSQMWLSGLSERWSEEGRLRVCARSGAWMNRIVSDSSTLESLPMWLVLRYAMESPCAPLLDAAPVFEI